LKKTLIENYENMFFEKLRSFNINNKLFLYSKKKNELLRKEFLTQIENLYPKLMGNNHIQNLDLFLSSSCLMQLAAPFIQKSLALRREDSI
jgi:hypothetical protein